MGMRGNIRALQRRLEPDSRAKSATCDVTHRAGIQHQGIPGGPWKRLSLSERYMAFCSAAMRSSSGGWLMNSRARPDAPAAIDAEGSHLGRQRLFDGPTSAAAVRRSCCPCRRRVRRRVGAEFAPPREPHDDHVGEDAQHDLRDDDGDEIADAAAALPLPEHGACRRCRRSRATGKTRKCSPRPGSASASPCRRWRRASSRGPARPRPRCCCIAASRPLLTATSAASRRSRWRRHWAAANRRCRLPACRCRPAAPGCAPCSPATVRRRWLAA